MNKANAENIEIDLVAIEDTAQIPSDEEIEVEKVNFEFDQNSEMHGMYRKFTVFNDTHGHLTIQNKHQRKHKYRVDIAYLEAKPYRQRRIAWKWLYACLCLLALLAVLYFGNRVNTESIASMGLAVGLVVVAIMTLIGFFYYTSDRVYFRSQFGKIKIIEFINNNPNKPLFRKFIGNLVRQIKSAKAAKGQNTTQALARELRELRRLKDEKVVPPATYDRAKARILKHPGFDG